MGIRERVVNLATSCVVGFFCRFLTQWGKTGTRKGEAEMFHLTSIITQQKHLARTRFAALAVSITLLAVTCALTASAQVVGTPTLGVARQGHTATLLADGKLLIAGGDAAGSAELFDPATQSFTALTDLLGLPRMFHSAARLPNGLVLIVGGVGPDNNPLYSGELFDPATQHFTTVGNSLHSARVLPTLRVLTDGKVQVLGGTQDNSMEIFDPAVGVFGAYAQLLPNSTKV